jgi:hypothetical protein
MHKRALTTVAAAASLIVLSGCPDWPRDNPADPTLCEPRCGVGARCWQGQCVPLSADLGPDTDTQTPDAGPDAPLTDADLGAADMQPDTVEAGPTCPAGYVKMTSGTTEHLTAVWGASSKEVFAVGKKGTILRYDGSAWSAMTSGTSADLYGVWGTGPKEVYAVGDQGTLLRYNGTAWSAYGPSTTKAIHAIWGAGGHLFAVGQGVIHQHDGKSWSTPALAGLGTLLSVHGSSNSDVYAVGGMAVLHYDGATWSNLTVPGPFVLSAVWGVNKTFIAVGVGVITGGPPPPLAVTIEAGALKSMKGATGKGLTAIWGSTEGASGIAKPGDVFAVGGGGTLLYYNGSVWHPQKSGVISNLSGVWRSEDNHVFVVGELGTILHGRGPWELVPRQTTMGLTEIWGDGTDIYVGGAMGTMLHHDGTTWAADSGGKDSIHGLWGDGKGTLYISGSIGTTGSGYLRKRSTGGSWTDVKTAPTPLFSLWGGGSGTIVAGGFSLVLHQTPSAPTTWTTDTNVAIVVRGLWGSGDSDVYAVGKGLTYHFDGSSWSADSTTAATDDLYAVWGASASDVFAVGGAGTIKRGKKGSWVDMKSGVSSILIGVGGSSTSDVYAVGQYGTILHYDGTSWTSTITGNSYELRDVWANGKDVYVVGGGGTVLRWCGP